jgi:hypothetical protein
VLRDWRHRWAEGGGESVGLLLVLLVSAGLGGAWVWARTPVSREPVVGRVMSVGFREDDMGSFRVASIAVDGRIVRVRMRAHIDCRAGDAVNLLRGRARLGVRYGIKVNDRRPCGRR